MTNNSSDACCRVGSRSTTRHRRAIAALLGSLVLTAVQPTLAPATAQNRTSAEPSTASSVDDVTAFRVRHDASASAALADRSSGRRPP
jgi:hypothetical protein